jgi:DNA-directed RNA polymerase subunit RPC12/RpoP
MRVNCDQCGASLMVLERDFYVRCPYCETSMLVRTPSQTTSLIEPVITPEEASRPFSGHSVTDVTLLYFPFAEDPGRDGSLTPAFSQVFEEMGGYRPPAGDRKVFSPDLVSPESLIPLDEEHSADPDTVVVYHPFFSVLVDKGTFSESFLVDAVSARPLLEPDPSGSEAERPSPIGLFSRALVNGLLVSVPGYLAAVTLGLPLFSRFLVALVLSASVTWATILRRHADGSSGEEERNG